MVTDRRPARCAASYGIAKQASDVVKSQIHTLGTDNLSPCTADFEGLTPYFKELRKKQHVTSQSLEKIEDG